MSEAVSIGQSDRVGLYEVDDNEMAVGSTLGGPRAICIIKANGALQTVFSPEIGEQLFGTVILRHYDCRTGMRLGPQGTGKFFIHPAHQEHRFTIARSIAVHEDIFVLSGEPTNNTVDPPGVYLVVELQNTGDETVEIATYAYADLRGKTTPDVVAEWDESLGALVAWNEGSPDHVRVFGASAKPHSHETTHDFAKVVALDCPGNLANATDARNRPLGALHHLHTLKPGAKARWFYLLSFGQGRAEAIGNYKACPAADQALNRTRDYYARVLSRSVVVTPNPVVNRGVLWAKANMLRAMLKTQTGWCFVNDPTRSVNSVGRDTAWFAYGADYIAPAFSRESLLAYVANQEKNGMIVEYYDTRTGETHDYGLNINDNTPLLILALWHHYNTSGDEGFLREIYPAAVKAAQRILSQRNKQGLVWCDSTKTSDWGIVGWRNVIKDYRLSGATTELNSECYAALRTLAHMARVLEKHGESAEFLHDAEALKTAINTHLANPANGLYYLNIDVDGSIRSDITSDLVFPVMFGVASEETSARIIRRLSDNDFWTAAGIRTVPRDAHNYDPDGTGDGPYGLLGGVWVGVSFWFAFAAAPYSPEYMDHALSASFRNYSMDPRRNNTVPGQFSEWLHGETLVNQGMMLSPWFPPRYLWAAIEGAAGMDLTGGALSITPRLASDWKWLGVRNLLYRGKTLAWLIVRTPELALYTTFPLSDSGPSRFYDEDISEHVHADGSEICAMGMRRGVDLLLFVGSTALGTITTAVRIDIPETNSSPEASYRLRRYDSLTQRWQDHGQVPAKHLRDGQILHIEHQGFNLLELTQEV